MFRQCSGRQLDLGSSPAVLVIPPSRPPSLVDRRPLPSSLPQIATEAAHLSPGTTGVLKKFRAESRYRVWISAAVKRKVDVTWRVEMSWM